MINQTPTDTTEDSREAMGEEELEQFKQQSVSGAISYTARSILLYGVGLVTSFILGSYFGPEQFAIYGIVTQLVSLLQFFSDVGLGPALIQQKEEPSTRDYRVVFTAQQILSWIIFAITIVIVLSGWLEPKIGNAGHWILIALGASFPLSALKTVPANIIQRKLDFSKLVIPAIFEQLVYNALLIYLVVTGTGVIAYAYAIAARAVVGVIVMYLLQGWDIGISFHMATIRRITSTGVMFQLSDLLAKIKDNLYYLVLGTMWLDQTSFGFIQFSKQWSHVPYMLTVQNVVSITFPAYSRLQHDPKRMARAIEKTIFFISLSIFPLLAGMSVFVDPLTHVIPSYAKWRPTIPTFIFFTLSIGWAALSTPLTNTLNARGEVDVTLKLMLFWTTLTWVLTPFFLDWFGFHGVALAAFAISFTSILPIILIKRRLEVDIWGQVWQPLLATLIMTVFAVVLLPVWRENLWWMLLGIAASGSLYGLSFLALGWRKLAVEIISLLRGKQRFALVVRRLEGWV
jgi:PST family polysaccharide transporter